MTNDEDVYKFLEFLLKTLKIKDHEHINLSANSMSKTEKTIIFEIDLGTGVKLRIEIPRIAK
jgi:hypothetical protein